MTTNKPILRTGRLSLRMTPDFLDHCAQVAAVRGQTLTEFTQQAMALNLLRVPVNLPEPAKTVAGDE